MEKEAIRFRCPHCRQKTIGVWQKLKANGFRPGQCPACGGKHVPAAWPALLAVILFFAGLAAPFLVAGSATVAGTWVLLVLGLVLGVLAVAATYMLCPLLRHGSRAARWESRSLLAALAVLVLCALLGPRAPTPAKPLFVIKNDQPPPARLHKGWTAKHFGDPAMQAQYKAALEKAQIPFTLERDEGRELVRVEKTHAAAAERVERELWGK